MLNFLKELWSALKKPKPIHLLVFYLFFVCIISGTILLLVCIPELTVFHYICFPIAAVSMAYFVYTITYVTPTAKQKIIDKLNNNKFTKKMLKNYGYRTIVMSVISFILNTVYVVFLGVLGIMTQSFWYLSITVYYLILSLVKGNVFYSQKKKNNKITQVKTYRFTGTMFIFLTIALSGIIVLIYKSNMYFEYAGIMIYAVAAYTFYYLGLAIYNIVKARRFNDFFIQSIRNINFVKAVVSVVVLQVAMFQAFSPQSNSGFANGLTAGAASIVILVTGVLMIVKSNKSLNEQKKPKNKEEIKENGETKKEKLEQNNTEEISK